MKTLLMSLIVTGCIVGDSTGTSTTDIIGGTDDTGDPAVGMLRFVTLSGQTAVCTATAIAPTIAISAAHCAEGLVFDVSFSATPDLSAPLGGGGYIHAQVIANPAYDGDPVHGHDVSIVELVSGAAPSTVVLGAAPGEGAAVRAVGYGMNVYGHDGTGIAVKRQIGVTVDSVLAHEIVVGGDGQTTCHGDSGGPIFDASGALVATDSYGEIDCHSPSHDMRIDDNLNFIHQFLGADAGGGGGTTTGTSTCDASQNGLEVKCTNGSCTCLVNGVQIETCTASDPATACSMPGNCCGF